jgi:phosphoribosylformylglycinamidine synthase I
MAEPNALIVVGFGINCDYETQHAFELAGATADRVHLNDLLDEKEMLAWYHIIALPGGFSFGDHVASGRVLANRLRYGLGPELMSFVADGGLVIGICNGFQVLVKMGMLPGFDAGFRQQVTLTLNDSGKFEDRWVHLKADPNSKCVFSRGISSLYLPVRHGEGKFLADSDETLERLQKNDQVVFRYCGPDGRELDPASGGSNYPFNPNGSSDDIAGICDPTGRVFGMMPHPEGYLYRENHPRWTREELPPEGLGRKVFQNAVEYVRSNL